MKMKAPAPLYMPYDQVKETKPDTKEFLLKGLKIPDKGGCIVVDKAILKAQKGVAMDVFK